MIQKDDIVVITVNGAERYGVIVEVDKVCSSAFVYAEGDKDAQSGVIYHIDDKYVFNRKQWDCKKIGRVIKWKYKI